MVLALFVLVFVFCGRPEGREVGTADAQKAGEAVDNLVTTTTTTTSEERASPHWTDQIRSGQVRSDQIRSDQIAT